MPLLFPVFCLNVLALQRVCQIFRFWRSVELIKLQVDIKINQWFNLFCKHWLKFTFRLGLLRGCAIFSMYVLTQSDLFLKRSQLNPTIY